MTAVFYALSSAVATGHILSTWNVVKSYWGIEFLISFNFNSQRWLMDIILDSTVLDPSEKLSYNL